MSALVLLPPLSAPSRRRHLVLVPPARRAVTSVPARRSRPCREGAPAPGPLRVTRRGRLALTTSVSVLVLAGGAAALPAPVPADPPAARSTAASAAPGTALDPAPSEVVVLPGDTLWSVADEVARPGQDVRDVVLAIQELNDLPTAELSVGDALVVPT